MKAGNINTTKSTAISLEAVSSPRTGLVQVAPVVSVRGGKMFFISYVASVVPPARPYGQASLCRDATDSAGQLNYEQSEIGTETTFIGLLSR